jgi:hypothetical protein
MWHYIKDERMQARNARYCWPGFHVSRLFDAAILTNCSSECMARLSDALRLEVLRRRDSGETFAKIAADMHIMPKTARKIVQKRDNYGTTYC